jgi:hypothetical protein
MVNDKLINQGRSIALLTGDLITFGQYPQQFAFEYEGAPTASHPMALKDEKISLVNKAKPTYAKIDHLSTPVQPGKTPTNVLLQYLIDRRFPILSPTLKAITIRTLDFLKQIRIRHLINSDQIQTQTSIQYNSPASMNWRKFLKLKSKLRNPKCRL